MDKKSIVGVLESIAVLLELKDENPFKVRAYANGARVLETLEVPLETLIDEDRLGKVRGIGDALAAKIETLYREGRLPLYEELLRSTPPGLLEMLEIPGLGGKKVRLLSRELGVETVAALKEAAEAGRVAELKGFGEKSQARILDGIRNRAAYAARHLWWDVRAVVEQVLEGLRALPAVERAEAAGSYRRLVETVGDLDFIVASSQPGPVMAWFVGQPGVQEVTAQGETKSSVRFEGGLQADIRVVPAAKFAFALHHFTGSKEHNVALRQRAKKLGFSLSEWGLSPEGGGDGDGPSAADEAELFAHLGLPYIPPELREGRGELEWAGVFPKLVNSDDIRGVFHNHTTASDGNDSLEAMAEAAARMGWDYFGLADHSQASRQANGLDAVRLRRQLAAVREYNARPDAALRVFAGVECDILTDGSLDLADEVLGELDYVVASVHSGFQQDSATMTARILRAIEHPLVTMLGHATGRLLLRRESYAVDLEAIIEAAVRNEVIIELNANPRRLDMDWRLWRKAAAAGLLTSINPDAHDVGHLAFVEAGVNVARKGWLTAENVFNTRPLDAVESWLAARRGRALARAGGG